MPKYKPLVPRVESEELPFNENDPDQGEDEDQPENFPAIVVEKEEEGEEMDPEDERQPDLVTEEMVLRAQQDSREGDQQARNRIMLAYAPMLRAIVGRLRVSPDEKQDLISTGVEAMLRAIMSWSPGKTSEKGTKVLFGQHLRFAIRHAVRDEFNRMRNYTSRGKPKAQIVRLDAPLPGDDTGKSRELPGMAPSPEQELLRHSVDDRWAKEVRKYINSLPGHEGELLRLKYVEGLPIVEVGRRLGIGASTAQAQLERAKLRMTKMLEPKLRDLQLPSSLTDRDDFGVASPKRPHDE